MQLKSFAMQQDLLLPLSGFNLLTLIQQPFSSRQIFVLLKPNKDRGAVKNIDAIQNIIRGKLAGITGGTFLCVQFSNRSRI